MKPRRYSISSAAEVQPLNIDLTVGVLKVNHQPTSQRELHVNVGAFFVRGEGGLNVCLPQNCSISPAATVHPQNIYFAAGVLVVRSCIERSVLHIVDMAFAWRGVVGVHTHTMHFTVGVVKVKNCMYSRIVFYLRFVPGGRDGGWGSLTAILKR